MSANDEEAKIGNSEAMLESALDYLGRGWSVIPMWWRKSDGSCACGDATCQSAAKHPILAWAVYQERLPTEDEVRGWWTRHPEANIAVVLGKASGGLAVLDIDERSLAERVVDEHGPGPYERTPRGGLHIFVRETEAPSRSGPLVPGVADLKANGGYVVVAPSQGYDLLQDGEPPRIADARQWALTFLAERGVSIPNVQSGGPAYEGLGEGPIAEGARNSTLLSLAGLLRRSGLNAAIIQSTLNAVNSQRCQPPLEPTEVAAIAASVSRYKPGDYVLVPRSSGATEWPQPLSDRAYHGLVGELVQLIKPHTEADPVALLVQFLIAFGNVVGTSPHFMVGADRHRMNLFACLVGKSSRGRKGSAWAYVHRLFRIIDENWTDRRLSSGLSSGEGLVWAVRDPICKGDRVVDEGVADKRLLVVEPEFAAPLRVMNREGNILSPHIRQAWESSIFQTITKNSPARATNPHVSIVGHITLEELRRYLRESEALNGFGNRFLWICVKRSKLLPEGGRFNDINFSPVLKRLEHAVQFARATGEMTRNDEARSRWGEIYETISEEHDGLVGAIISRAEAQVTRLACLFALLDRSRVVTAEAQEAALALWDYCDASARYIFGDHSGDDTADRILRALRANAHGLTRTEIRDLFDRNKPSPVLDQVLASLIERGLVRSTTEQTDGRPAVRWFAR